ncbi:hypothetical protein ZIOFF_027110 [Zingiber officinale]|uniref:Uncharacterized protein n=1 Tax=Zingiber officinale TaxID=94328 RepID=A0A8J5H7S7_ZINOF|nr:hypothetical protein ZIOFF_027110 [Zingiber officinale]
MVHAPMREDQLRQRTSFCGAGACKLRWIAAAPKAQKRGRSHALSRHSTAAPADYGSGLIRNALPLLQLPEQEDEFLEEEEVGR